MQPDFDAFASAFSLKGWLKDNFPGKVVYLIIPPRVIKPEEQFLFQHEDELPSEEELKKCLGIVVDTPNQERILTDLYKYCKELVVIDHHPKSKPFSDLEFIDPTYPATAQILSEMFIYWESEEGGKYAFKEKIAQYLYAGIITDTNNFLSLSMLPSTYQVLASLVSKGLNRASIHNWVFVKPLIQKLLEIKILENCYITKNGLIFAIVTPKMMNKYKIKNVPAIITMLENISNIECWSVLFYEQSTDKWKCSIRSKDLTINQIAKIYGGGGHSKMAAVTFDKKSNYYKLLATLDEYLANHGFANVSLLEKKKNWRLSLIKRLKKYKSL
nr:bifunctional oligoribonuclease/PAP phosphatase NrnA [Candidatus Mycoplasma haemohominis]